MSIGGCPSPHVETYLPNRADGETFSNVSPLAVHFAAPTGKHSGDLFKCFPVGAAKCKANGETSLNVSPSAASTPAASTPAPGAPTAPVLAPPGQRGNIPENVSPTRLSQRRGNISAPARRGNIPDPADGETFQNVSPSGPPRRGNILNFSGFQAEMFPRRWDPRPRGMFPRRPGRPPAPAECFPVPRIWVTAPTGKHPHNVSPLLAQQRRGNIPRQPRRGNILSPSGRRGNIPAPGHSARATGKHSWGNGRECCPVGLVGGPGGNVPPSDGFRRNVPTTS